MSGIHSTAIVDPGAQLGEGVTIGPFSVIGPKVVLGDRVQLKSHVVVTGMTEIGEDTSILPFSVIGEIPQDLKYDGEETRLVVGARNRIREHVTMNTGTSGGGGITRVGDEGLFMAGCHVAHDVQIGNRVILANSVAVAGHAIVEDDVILGGLAGVHQFVRIGQGAIIGGITRVVRDVIPYGMVQTTSGELEGLNLIGLKRRGLSRADIGEIRAAYQALGQEEGTFQDRARKLAEANKNDFVRNIIDFITTESDRSYLVPKG